MLVSWQQYLQLRQKNLQCAKNTTANAVKQVLKPAKKGFCPYLSWQWYLLLTQNYLLSAKIRTANAVNPISKRLNKRFYPYIGNRTSNKCKEHPLS